eukprot:scaffold5773_cov36-Tisochrysis_lutea.AAC.2
MVVLFPDEAPPLAAPGEAQILSMSDFTNCAGAASTCSLAFGCLWRLIWGGGRHNRLERAEKERYWLPEGDRAYQSPWWSFRSLTAVRRRYESAQPCSICSGASTPSRLSRQTVSRICCAGVVSPASFPSSSPEKAPSGSWLIGAPRLRRRAADLSWTSSSRSHTHP